MRIRLTLALALSPAISWGQGPAGAEFQVNSYTTDVQRFPAVTSDGSGNFVVVWQSAFQDGSSYGVYGQRFLEDVIFKDGFE
jgi:hypothetical protein